MAKRKVKAQVSIFTVIFLMIIFFIVFAVALAPLVGTMSGVIIDAGQLTGLEAFFVANLILFFIFGFIIMILWMSK